MSTVLLLTYEKDIKSRDPIPTTFCRTLSFLFINIIISSTISLSYLFSSSIFFSILAAPLPFLQDFCYLFKSLFDFIFCPFLVPWPWSVLRQLHDLLAGIFYHFLKLVLIYPHLIYYFILF